MMKHINKTSNEYSKFIMIDMQEKLKPINKSIDDMHARLEEFQIMITFAKQERVGATDLLNAISNCKNDVENLFTRIDSVEDIVEHVRTSLLSLEADIEKAEEEIGYTESTTTKVANMFTPLFKKSAERKHTPNSLNLYKTSDYFH
jgi:predicted  nucleic acid-binding Zn-ribbon protein